MRFAVLFAAALASSALMAATLSPEQIWQKGIDDQNTDYAKTPHAMLKIQDSAYLHDGDTAVLIGQTGSPASYRWNHDPKARGALVVTFKGGKISVTKNGTTVSEDALTKGISIDKDVDIDGQPTQVDVGVNGWRIFVFNQQNAAAKDFKGVSYYPYDASYRVTAKFTLDPKLPPRIFRTSRGTDKQFYHVGDARFSLQGKQITLPFYGSENDPKKIIAISTFYTDDNTGKGAYGAGRYVDIGDFGKFPPSAVTIDFNTAYNPNCARSAHFTCPIATDSIALAMNAGEKDPHMAH
jgi:uncharacterized protein (DUF1684 family)